MITRRNVVLYTTKYGCPRKDNINFEAVEVINSLDKVRETWRKNKIPLIYSDDNLYEEAKWQYRILKLPKWENPDEFIFFCHENGIECGEYIDKNSPKIDTKSESCFLCDIAEYYKRYESLTEYNASVENLRDMIMYESENFFVKIELGCLCKGMVMICPKEHIYSVASIQSEEKMSEYKGVMADVELILKTMYGAAGPVIFFEHGSSPDGFSTHKRSVVHAHTHVAYGVKFSQYYLNMVCLKPIDDIREMRGGKYLSYQEGVDGQLFAVNDKSVYVQRQFPRQVIGEILGIPNELTNWRVEPFSENMKETFDDWYKVLITNKDILPKRILERTEGFVIGYEKREKVLV